MTTLRWTSRDLEVLPDDGKPFVMMGVERGFDLSSEESINQWMAMHSAELAAGAGLPSPCPENGARTLSSSTRG
jgi:hypothetical protein